jgi:TrmH family RNA methyltransferase
MIPSPFPVPAPFIRSRSNAVVRRFRALKERSAADLALLEGTKLLEEALAAGAIVTEVAASPRAGRGARGRALLQALERRGVPVRFMDEDVLGSVSEAETSQGLLALARRPAFAEEALFGAHPLLLVAVGIQNPGNVGALLRAAEAAGASGAYLAEGCADPFSWKALRGSMGSAFRLPHRRRVDARETLRRLEARGVATVAAVASAEARYDEADLVRPVALVVGSEGSGLDEGLAAAASARVAIPMRGGVESLNVAVAAGILLFEAARQRRL